MSRPRVAITLGAATKAAVVQTYVSYLEASGADTVVVLPGQDIPWHEIQGLVLGGGADVDPAAYGQPKQQLTEVEPERDALELPAARHALENHIPILGICRGFQLLNVVLGGTLVQHLDGHTRDDGGHSTRHRARIMEGTSLHAALGRDQLTVNSSHHQAVRAENLAPRLTPAATTDDGLIEAFEAPNVLAVQWHPERVDELDPENRNIGKAFVDALRAPAALSS